MATSVNGLLNGNLQFLNQGYGLTGYPDYGGFDGDPVNGNAFIFLVKLGGSPGPIWLDTDLNKATGYNGYDYHVIWSTSGPPKLYSGSLGQTLIATLTDYVYVPNPDNPTAQPALEFAIPTNLIGGAKSAFVTLGAGTSYITAPQAPGVAVETIGTVTLDGNLSDWTQAQRIDAAAPNPNMDVYGRNEGGDMIFALHLNSGDFKSASYTTLWLDADFNRATGFSVPVSNTAGAPQVQVGAEYNLRFDTAGHVILEKGNTLWPAYSPNGAAVYSETIGPVPFAFSADYKSVEVAVPLAMLGANVTGAVVHVDSSYGGGPALTANGYVVGTAPLGNAAPSAPSAPDLVAASDTGSSSTDNVTSVTTPTVTGNGAEPGATVTLYDTDGTTVLGTAIADGSGNWSITSSTLGGGDHALTVKQTDLAGDVSAASATLTVTIEPPQTAVYVLQGINPAVIGAAPVDVKAISMYDDTKQLFTAAQVQQMGGGPGGGVLLGYLSVGEAETYRNYFATIPPAALGPEDPNFPGSYQVAYWTDAWRSVTTGIIDQMIALGYDGAVFDVVGEYQQPWAQSNAPGGDAAGAMMSLVEYLSAYAHAQDPNFQIWINGAPELLGNSTYLQAIDGEFMESLFYDGTGNTRPATDSSYSLGFLDQAMAAGKSVINIEYVSGAAQIADVHAKDAAAGIGSYIAQPALNGIDMEGAGLTVPAPAPVTVGTGSDTLVLSMSEDAYLGDAQFTVAVDGTQLGGTFTTTALHTFGTSQTFTFMGDWGVGTHTVTVEFLNDLYAGTPATDRNLYIDAISYDGTNTNQSAAVIGFVPSNFTVTDTTAILPPTISGTAAGQLTTDRQVVAPFSGVAITDPNANQSETVTVTLSAAANGTLSNLGTGSYDATTGVYTVTGTAAAVTAALDGLVFTPAIDLVPPGQTVTTTFTIADADSARATATDSTTTVVATDVGAPTLAAPASATVNQSVAALIAGVSLAEVGNVAGETFTVTVSDTNGLLSATGTGVTGSGTKSLAISGSLAAVNSALATLSDTDGTTPSDRIVLTAVDSFGVAAAPQSIAVTVTPGLVYTLTTGKDTVAGGAVNNTIIAKTATLNATDYINGGTAISTLALQGGGSFNLAAPATLRNIAIITAQEGSGAAAQTITLRNNLNSTVNVTAGGASSGITIIGATNTDVINLGTGNDTVTPGSGETVNGGSGNDVYNVTRNTIGNVTINGGSGSNTLVVTGGGTATMSSKITGMNAVQLATTTNFTANTTAGLTISGSSVGGDTITPGAPTQSVIAGGPNETIKATAANAGTVISVGANSTLQVTSGGSIALNAATDVATVKLSAASTLLLNGMQFITAVGSGGNDTITAGATNQTLTGGAGTDTLVGFSGGSDIFKDTAAHLNGDTINGFVASDTIDLTNIAFAGATVTAVASGANTTRVTVASGLTRSVFTVTGSSLSGFHLASDGIAGTILTHS